MLALPDRRDSSSHPSARASTNAERHSPGPIWYYQMPNFVKGLLSLIPSTERIRIAKNAILSNYFDIRIVSVSGSGGFVSQGPPEEYLQLV
jgi:hypothetical protein